MSSEFNHWADTKQLNSFLPKYPTSMCHCHSIKSTVWWRTTAFFLTCGLVRWHTYSVYLHVLCSTVAMFRGPWCCRNLEGRSVTTTGTVLFGDLDSRHVVLRAGKTQLCAASVSITTQGRGWNMQRRDSHEYWMYLINRGHEIPQGLACIKNFEFKYI